MTSDTQAKGNEGVSYVSVREPEAEPLSRAMVRGVLRGVFGATVAIVVAIAVGDHGDVRMKAVLIALAVFQVFSILGKRSEFPRHTYAVRHAASHFEEKDHLQL